MPAGTMRVRLGQIGIALEGDERPVKVAAGLLENLASRYLHLEGPFEPENDVQEIDGFRSQVVNQRGFKRYPFFVASQSARHCFCDLRKDRHDVISCNVHFGDCLLFHLETAIHVEDLPGDVVGVFRT